MIFATQEKRNASYLLFNSSYDWKVATINLKETNNCIDTQVAWFEPPGTADSLILTCKKTVHLQKYRGQYTSTDCKRKGMVSSMKNSMVGLKT